MKTLSYIFLKLSIFACFMILLRCEPPVRLTKIETGIISDVESTTAKASLLFADLSGNEITSFGHCWNTSDNPTISDYNNTISGKAAKDVYFYSNLAGLASNTKYYVRAYAIDGGTTVYGDVVEFVTLALVPTVITQDAIDISATSATLKGSVNANGEKVSVSFEWGTTTAYGNTVAASPSSVSGNSVTAVSAGITGLTTCVAYHFRLKTEQNGNKTFGDDKFFATNSLPLLSTTAISTITHNSANSGGNISSDGGSDITARGVCWSTTPEPAIEDAKTTNGSGTGTYTSSLEGLNPNTDYYVRAYATNSVGTGYGNEQSFKTLVAPYINITSPTGDSLWEMAFIGQIKWEHNISVNVKIELLKAGIPVGDDIELNIANSGSYNWAIPGSLSDGNNYQIRISSVDNASISGTSPNFEIFGKISDYDGNTYRIVKIGEQWWMRGNMRATHYSDGDEIPNISLNSDWNDLSYVNIAYCYYNNNPDNDSIYGALYTWFTAMNRIGAEKQQGVCPTGWHIPTDGEWKQLEISLGMDPGTVDGLNDRGEDEGNMLKEEGTSHWSTAIGTNISGFTAVGSGFRSNTGAFYDYNNYGQFWTSTIEGSSYAWYRELSHNLGSIYRNNYDQNYGRSVRCVKD